MLFVSNFNIHCLLFSLSCSVYLHIYFVSKFTNHLTKLRSHVSAKAPYSINFASKMFYEIFPNYRMFLRLAICRIDETLISERRCSSAITEWWNLVGEVDGISYPLLFSMLMDKLSKSVRILKWLNEFYCFILSEHFLNN